MQFNAEVRARRPRRVMTKQTHVFPAECSARSCAREREPGSTRLELTVPETKAAPKVVPGYLELRGELQRRIAAFATRSCRWKPHLVRDAIRSGSAEARCSGTPNGHDLTRSPPAAKGSPSRAASSPATATCCFRRSAIASRRAGCTRTWGVSKVMRHHVETKPSSTNGAWPWASATAPASPSCRSAPCWLGRAQAAAGAGRNDCPFTGEKILLVPALNPDVALVHVQRCDAYGNAQIDGSSSWTLISPSPPTR